MTFKTFLAATALLVPASMAIAQTDTTDSATTPPAAGAETEPGTAADTPAGDAGAAAQADVTAGATVHDPSGGTVGTVESVEGQTAVVSTGTVKVGVPLSAIGKNDRGLVIAMTKAELEAAAAANGAN